MSVPFAAVRNDIAEFVAALITVYSFVIIAYIVANLIFSFGGRMPYSGPVHAAYGFLRDLSEPYLRIFRRFVPSIGMFDLSPIVALFALQIVGFWIVVPLIAG